MRIEKSPNNQNDQSGNETKSVILKTVRENGGISRQEVAKITGYSGATVTRLTESLINEDDLIEERGNQRLPKGRPLKKLYFKGNNKYAIGIDLGTTFIRGVLADLNMEVIKEIEVMTEADQGPENVFRKIIYVINSLQDTRLIDPEKIIGIGLALAGIVNTSKGIVEYSPAFNWRNIKVLELLSSKIELPIYFDNVSRVMAKGELQFGKGNEFDNFIMINVGYGIGAGIVLNKQLFYGTDGMAGEFGHVPVHGDGLVTCPCGKNSCLTAYASGYAIEKRARMKMEKDEESKLWELSKNNPENIDAKMVFKACRTEDSLAIKIIQDSMDYLGMSIAGLINVFNPQAVFIGGGVSLSGRTFWDKLKESVNKNVFDHRSTEYTLLPTTYPGKIAIYGAVSLVLDKVLNLEIRINKTKPQSTI